MSLLHTAHLVVRGDAVDAFKARIIKHAALSLEIEDGCQQFDVHQDREKPTLFFLIETYADEAALEAHRQSTHYKSFRQDVRDWIIDRKWWYWNGLNSP